MTILKVSNLSKKYPSFTLHDINFSLDEYSGSVVKTKI